MIHNEGVGWHFLSPYLLDFLIDSHDYNEDYNDINENLKKIQHNKLEVTRVPNAGEKEDQQSHREEWLKNDNDSVVVLGLKSRLSHRKDQSFTI